MKRNNREKKQQEKYIDNINMCIALGITILMMLLIGYIISVMLPNTLNIEYIESNYIKPISDFEAEQSERMQYVVLTIVFPILYICVYKVIQKLDIKINNYKKTYNAFMIFNVFIILSLLFWSAINTEKMLILQIAVNGAVGALILVIYQSIKNKHAITYGMYAITAAIIIIVSYLFINPTFEQGRFMSHHVDAYYYPILKITSGLTPYVDFTPLYGCYSYIFAFIQNIMNNESLICFSIINAVLVAIVLINLSIIINKTIKNKAIAFITFMAIIFPMIIYSFVINNSPYLQYMPHRVLFCSCILLFINIYLKYRKTNKKLLLQIIGYIISSLAIFWNIETGLVVLIVWTAVLGYEILFFNSLKDKKAYLAILKLLIMAIMSLFTAYFMIMMISYIRTGKIVGINNILSSQLLFYKDGFYMIKMYFGKPWMILIYTYLIGLAITLRKLYLIKAEQKVMFNKNAMIFALSILGVGIFSYYQGRSHDEVFASVTYPAIILIGIFADVSLRKIKFLKKKKEQLPNIIIVVINIGILSLLSMLTIVSLIRNGSIHLLLDKEKIKNISILEDFSDYDTSNMEFITEYESLYYKKYNLKDEKNFSAKVDLFTYKDCEKVKEYLKETDKNIVIDKELFCILKEKYVNEYEKSIINKFTIEESEKNMILINNKK